jgi:hypothetical protein
MLKQISLFNVIVGLFSISVPAMAEQTTVVQSQQVVTEPGKPPAVQQSTFTNSTVSPTITTTLSPDQVLKLLNSTVRLPNNLAITSIISPTTPNSTVNLSLDQLKQLNSTVQIPTNMMQIPSAVIITLPSAK